MSKTRRNQASDDKLRQTQPYKRRRYQLDNLVDWQDDRWQYL